MGITVKEVLELLREKVSSKDWDMYDSGFEIAAILDFGRNRRELENSIVLDHFLNKHNIDMVFNYTGVHFIKL